MPNRNALGIESAEIHGDQKDGHAFRQPRTRQRVLPLSWTATLLIFVCLALVTCYASCGLRPLSNYPCTQRLHFAVSAHNLMLQSYGQILLTCSFTHNRCSALSERFPGLAMHCLDVTAYSSVGLPLYDSAPVLLTNLVQMYCQCSGVQLFSLSQFPALERKNLRDHSFLRMTSW